MGWNLANAVGMSQVGMPAIPTPRNAIGSIFSNYTTGAPTTPVYGSRPAGGYAPIPPVVIPEASFKPITATGVSPGFINATPAYKTTNPAQAQFYWGAQPYVETMADMKKLNNPAVVGTKPWGVQDGAKSFDLNGFLRDFNKTAAANAPKYPGLPGYTAPKTITRK